MCGIAGLFRLDGASASAADVRRMVEAMPHRGPDGRGAWADGPVALGHGRLAVRALGPEGAQPMCTPGGEGVLVYNGEVYDDRAVAADLAREGVEVPGTSDTAVVAAACARWGPLAAARRLDGMFAFAWWDARERALWLVRDRFGVKPLHVAVTGTTVAFASELRGLRALDGLARRPDLLEVARRLLGFSVDELRPPFEGVENVLPGQAWRVSAAGVERRTWWDEVEELDLDRLRAAAREPVAAWEARTEAAVRDAVASHLVSDVPVAVFASGGVDSNLVASFARERVPGLVGYTADTCHRDSEVAAAKAMAAATGLALRVVRVDRDAYLRAWPASIAALEHPQPHTSAPAALLLARAARADGIVVALTGEGSDELFGGYDFLVKTRRNWRRRRLPWSRFGSYRRDVKTLRETPFFYQPARHEPAIHRRLAVALASEDETRAHRLLRALSGIEDDADRAFVANSIDALRRHMGWIVLRHDRLGMAASLECRVPFLSRGPADVAMHLPVRARVRGRHGKWVLKRVAARRLPPRLVWAKKKGFPVPDGHHVGASNLLRGGLLPDLLRWSRAAAEDLVPRVEADPVLRPQMASFELWARIFLRGDSLDDATDALLRAVGPGRPTA